MVDAKGAKAKSPARVAILVVMECVIRTSPLCSPCIAITVQGRRVDNAEPSCAIGVCGLAFDAIQTSSQIRSRQQSPWRPWQFALGMYDVNNVADACRQNNVTPKAVGDDRTFCEKRNPGRRPGVMTLIVRVRTDGGATTQCAHSVRQRWPDAATDRGQRTRLRHMCSERRPISHMDHVAEMRAISLH